ncbi:MAG: hypothetical protein FWC70_11705 [Defluviitaleaceae bacterium]|nr:hypothetical protein [Defluviitaleaceae bacterium]
MLYNTPFFFPTQRQKRRGEKRPVAHHNVCTQILRTFWQTAIVVKSGKDSDSDVDIFVLADVPQEETNRWSNSIDDRLPDFLYDYELLVCIHLTSKELFDRYYHVQPYYQNVIKEGVELHG